MIFSENTAYTHVTYTYNFCTIFPVRKTNEPSWTNSTCSCLQQLNVQQLTNHDVIKALRRIRWSNYNSLIVIFWLWVGWAGSASVSFVYFSHVNFLVNMWHTLLQSGVSLSGKNIFVNPLLPPVCWHRCAIALGKVAKSWTVSDHDN